jgi:hypothetical protein
MSANVTSYLAGSGMTVIGLFLGLVIFRSTYRDIRLWQAARSSQHWAVTTGDVLTSKTEVNRRLRKPIIEYTYLVNGVRFTGNRVMFDTDGLYTWHEAETVIDHYAPSKPVSVYYDPDNPQESALERRHRGIASSLLLKAFLLFLPTGLCLCLGLFALADATGLVK